MNEKAAGDGDLAKLENVLAKDDMVVDIVITVLLQNDNKSSYSCRT